MLTLPHLKMLDVARWLLIGLSITILFSPFLSNVIEITLLGLFIFNQELRSRLANIKKQPLAIEVLFGIISIHLRNSRLLLVLKLL